MTRLSFDELAALDELQWAYMEALDRKEMHGWLACFADAPEAAYILNSRDNVERGLRIAMMLDDCRDRLIDRCTFVEQVWAGTFQDYRTRHFAQRVHVERVAAEGAGQGGNTATLCMRSHFSVNFTPDDTGISALLATGVYEDVVRLADNRAQLLSRLTILDTAVLPRYLVFPL